MSAVLCPISLQTIFRDGRPVIGAKVLMYEAGTTTPKTVYQESTLQAAHPRPILTDSQGMVPPIYVGKGDYKFRLLSSGDVLIGEVDGLPGAVTSTDAPDPGETYPLTDPTSILITGDIIAAHRTGSRAGFARCNGNTVGNVSSGASEIAVGLPSNQEQPVGSAYKLFVHLWENDASLPVYSAGVQVSRGATAIADWDANRQLGLPDLRGRAPTGLDGMGGPDASRLQLTRSATMTGGDAYIYPTSTDDIVIGMTVLGNGVPVGTKVSWVQDSRVGLSTPPTLTGSSTLRFSYTNDARTLGTVGGAASFKMILPQIPSHNHGAVTGISINGEHGHTGYAIEAGEHQHTYQKGGFATGLEITQPGNSSFFNSSDVTSPSGRHTHQLSISVNGSHNHTATTTIYSSGENKSVAVMQPILLLTFYIKL